MKSAILTPSFLLLGLGLSAQGFTDYPWTGDMSAATEIPAEFQQADAVLLKNETYNTSKFSGTYPYLEQSASYRTQVHAKILTQKGLDDFKRIIVPRFRGRIGDYVQMKHVDVRIRKADGKVQDLTVRNLPKPTLTEDDELFDAQDEVFVYEIPDLAIGDEIERVTVLEAKFADQGRIVNLYSEYPTLEVKFVLSVPSNVAVNGRTYNSMPDPAVKNLASGQREYSWTMKNLKAVPEANSAGSIATEKLEYIIYELNLDKFRSEMPIEIKSFGDLLWQYAEDFLVVQAGKKKMEEFYNKVFDNKTETLGQLEKLVMLNDYIAKKLRIVGGNELDESERGQNLEYFLFNNKATPTTVLLLYRDFFTRFGIDYYLAFGKSRFNGPIDITFPSQTQVSDYFFIVKTSDGKQLIVEGLNGINELPTGLWGTTCYFRDIRDRKAGLSKIDFGQDLLLDAKNNKRLRRAQWDINTTTHEITQKLSTELKGVYATEGRGGWTTANKADTLPKAVQRSYSELFKNAEVTVTEALVKQHETLPPYDFKTAFTLQVKNWLKPENNSYSISLERWFLHNVRAVTNPDNRVLDYHAPFVGSDVEDLVLVFDKDVKLTNMAELAQKVDNEYATYECKITQVNTKTIRIESRYTIKQLKIPAADVAKLEAVNKALEKVLEAKWLFAF